MTNEEGHRERGPPIALLRCGDEMRYLFQEKVKIGRNRNADLFLDGKTVSHNHAVLEIFPRSKHAILHDLNSRNGCFVNGTLIQNTSCAVQSEDRLRFGYDKTTYVFSFFVHGKDRGPLGPLKIDHRTDVSVHSGAAPRTLSPQRESLMGTFAVMDDEETSMRSNGLEDTKLSREGEERRPSQTTTRGKQKAKSTTVPPWKQSRTNSGGLSSSHSLHFPTSSGNAHIDFADNEVLDVLHEVKQPSQHDVHPVSTSRDHDSVLHDTKTLEEHRVESERESLLKRESAANERQHDIEAEMTDIENFKNGGNEHSDTPRRAVGDIISERDDLVEQIRRLNHELAASKRVDDVDDRDVEDVEMSKIGLDRDENKLDGDDDNDDDESGDDDFVASVSGERSQSVRLATLVIVRTFDGLRLNRLSNAWDCLAASSLSRTAVNIETDPVMGRETRRPKDDTIVSSVSSFRPDEDSRLLASRNPTRDLTIRKMLLERFVESLSVPLRRVLARSFDVWRDAYEGHVLIRRRVKALETLRAIVDRRVRTRKAVILSRWRVLTRADRQVAKHRGVVLKRIVMRRTQSLRCNALRRWYAVTSLLAETARRVREANAMRLVRAVERIITRRRAVAFRRWLESDTERRASNAIRDATTNMNLRFHRDAGARAVLGTMKRSLRRRMMKRFAIWQRDAKWRSKYRISTTLSRLDVRLGRRVDTSLRKRFARWRQIVSADVATCKSRAIHIIDGLLRIRTSILTSRAFSRWRRFRMHGRARGAALLMKIACDRRLKLLRSSLWIWMRTVRVSRLIARSLIRKARDATRRSFLRWRNKSCRGHGREERLRALRVVLSHADVRLCRRAMTRWHMHGGDEDRARSRRRRAMGVLIAALLRLQLSPRARFERWRCVTIYERARRLRRSARVGALRTLEAMARRLRLRAVRESFGVWSFIWKAWKVNAVVERCSRVGFARVAFARWSELVFHKARGFDMLTHVARSVRMRRTWRKMMIFTSGDRNRMLSKQEDEIKSQRDMSNGAKAFALTFALSRFKQSLTGYAFRAWLEFVRRSRLSDTSSDFMLRGIELKENAMRALKERMDALESTDVAKLSACAHVLKTVEIHRRQKMRTIELLRARRDELARDVVGGQVEGSDRFLSSSSAAEDADFHETFRLRFQHVVLDGLDGEGGREEAMACVKEYDRLSDEIIESLKADISGLQRGEINFF